MDQPLCALRQGDSCNIPRARNVDLRLQSVVARPNGCHCSGVKDRIYILGHYLFKCLWVNDIAFGDLHRKSVQIDPGGAWLAKTQHIPVTGAELLD